jgi:isopenicillin N synthase-like dioxygenase
MASKRIFPRISLGNYENRRDEITKDLVKAAEGPGFFIAVDHGISAKEINEQVSRSKSYFALPDSTCKIKQPWRILELMILGVKAQNAFVRENNAGWEKQAQIRPSTGTPDQKESLQLQFGQERMQGKWPTEDTLPSFKNESLAFMEKVQRVSLKIMSCFAEALGLPLDFFDKAHDTTKDDCLTVLRCLHYHDITGQTFPANYWRAGAHTGTALAVASSCSH